MKTKSGKASKHKEPESAPVVDPLSGAAEVADPLSSFSPANDPLSAALLDPLSQAASEASSFGSPEKKKVCGAVEENNAEQGGMLGSPSISLPPPMIL